MNQEQYDEIDLMDYVLVLIKRKWTIVAILLVAVIVAGIFSFLAEKIYRVDTVLQIGKISGDYLEEPNQIKAKIEGRVFREIIRKEMNIAEKDYPEIKAEQPDKTNLIILKIETYETEKALAILQRMNELILNEHETIFKEKRENTEETIENLQKELDFLKNYKVYADLGIYNLQSLISQKQYSLIDSRETQIIKNLVVSENPIKPNKKFNIVIAGILGLFLGIFVAFFREWWLKTKP